MKPNPDKIGATIDKHVEYWHSLQLEGYQGRSFADRSGGLILFEAATVEEAKEITSKDPFVVNGLLSQRWVKVWASPQ